MSIEEAKSLLAQRGFKFLELLAQQDGVMMVLCEKKNGIITEVAIEDGEIFVAPS